MKAVCILAALATVALTYVEGQGPDDCYDEDLGTTVPHGESWFPDPDSDPCFECTCTYGKKECKTHQCEVVTECPDGSKPYRAPGECCELCPENRRGSRRRDSVREVSRGNAASSDSRRQVQNQQPGGGDKAAPAYTGGGAGYYSPVSTHQWLSLPSGRTGQTATVSGGVVEQFAIVILVPTGCVFWIFIHADILAGILVSCAQLPEDKQDEVDSLQMELGASRQEKADQKSRVSELRSVLKASVQHHKLTKKLNSRKKAQGGGDADNQEKATQADMGNGVIIPPLPFDMDAVEQLLLDTAVKPLDSKPLDNLSNCLSSLRAEITGLQKQMEVHTTTIHSSSVSFRNVESEVKGLQEVVRSIANTIMEGSNTTTGVTTTTAATDTEVVLEEDGDVVHL
ncbi:hypothetical protein ACOMHN_053459 [Nucella lapillus]